MYTKKTAERYVDILKISRSTRVFMLRHFPKGFGLSSLTLSCFLDVAVGFELLGWRKRDLEELKSLYTL
jgi:hypothetical protein